MRDDLSAGADTIEGDGTVSLTGARGDFDDVIFGDYGIVTQAISHVLVGDAVGTAGGYVRPAAPPLRIQTTHRVLVVETTRYADGGIDNLKGNGGDDFLLGGAQGDTIDGGTDENVVFGDHGRISGQVDPTIFNRPIPFTGLFDTYPITTLELVESVVPAGEQGGADTITTGTGRDMIFGGAGGDVITANVGETGTLPDGNNIVFGDYGFVDYVAPEIDAADDAHDIDVVSSLVPFTNLGGADTIVRRRGERHHHRRGRRRRPQRGWRAQPAVRRQRAALVAGRDRHRPTT